MHEADKLAIARASSNTLLKHFEPFSACVFDTKNSNDPAEWELFSGTLIQIDRHVLMATASHCVETNAPLTRYWILGHRPRFRREGIPEVLATWSTPGDAPDVGILEIEPDSLRRCSDAQPCSFDRIQPCGTGRPNRLASLMGTPSKYVDQESRGNELGFKAVPLSYSTRVLDISEWPNLSVKRPPDEQVDVLLEYPNGADRCTRLDTGDPVQLPSPKGMSGGGLWDQGFTADLWSPDRAFLFGIQSDWFPDRRYVRAVQIVHWLRLVHDKYPDLRPALNSKFPNLNQT